MSAAPLTIVCIGNSITGSVPPGGTTTPGEQAAALLSTRLGMTVTAAVAPWHGLFGGDPANGAQTTDDLPSDPRGTGNYAAILAAGAGTPMLASIMLGTNDARYSSNSASLFGGNLSTLVAALVALGWKVILNYDPAFDTGVGGFNTSGNLALLQSYQAKYDVLVDNVSVFAGDTTLYSLFAANHSWLYDGTHPDAANGVPAIASAWARAWAPTLARYVQWSPPPKPGAIFG